MNDLVKLMEKAARARRDGRTEDAYRGYVEAVAVCRAGQDMRSLISALRGLGQIERDRGYLEAALSAYEEAVALARHEGDPLVVAHTVRHAGDILRHMRRFDEADACYREALAFNRERPEAAPLDLANAVRAMAVLKETLKAEREALLLWKEARQIYASLGVQAGVDECNARLAKLEQKQQ